MSLERLRAGINRALKTMRAGEIPGQPLASRYGVPPEILGPFDIPYRAALDVAIEARCTEIAQTPIDDAAWEEESCSGAATLRPGSGNSRSTASLMRRRINRRLASPAPRKSTRSKTASCPHRTRTFKPLVIHFLLPILGGAAGLLGTGDCNGQHCFT
jgi:hypothetical protein